MSVDLDGLSLKLKLIYNLDWFPCFSLKDWTESRGIPDAQIGINGDLFVKISGTTNPNFYQELFRVSNMEQVRNRIAVQETSFKRVILGEEREPNLMLCFRHKDGYNPARWLSEAMDCHNIAFTTTMNKDGTKVPHKENQVKISVHDILCLLGPKEIVKWFPI